MCAIPSFPEGQPPGRAPTRLTSCLLRSRVPTQMCWAPVRLRHHNSWSQVISLTGWSSLTTETNLWPKFSLKTSLWGQWGNQKVWTNRKECRSNRNKWASLLIACQIKVITHRSSILSKGRLGKLWKTTSWPQRRFLSHLGQSRIQNLKAPLNAISKKVNWQRGIKRNLKA